MPKDLKRTVNTPMQKPIVQEVQLWTRKLRYTLRLHSIKVGMDKHLRNLPHMKLTMMENSF